MDLRGFGLAMIWGAARVGLPTKSLHRLVYRDVGPRFRIGRGSRVLGRDVRIGADVRIGKRCDIVAESIAIDDGVVIDDDVCIRCKKLILKKRSRIDPSVTIRGVATPRSAFELGVDAWIFSHCFLDSGDRLVIGDRTALGSHCLVFTHSSYLPLTHGYPVRFAPVIIGADVWLPWHAFVLPGVVIGDGATVGAFSMVASSVPPNSLAVGVPARIVKDAASYRRRYDDVTLRKVADDMVRETLSRWEGSFRAREIFRPAVRSVQQVDANAWRLVDRGAPVHVWLLTDAADTESIQVPPAASEPRNLLITVGRLRPPVAGATWIDLETLQSSGLSRACPEVKALTDLFSHFGLRFDWLPGDLVAGRLSIEAMGEQVVQAKS